MRIYVTRVAINNYCCAIAVNQFNEIVAVSLPSKNPRPQLNLRKKLLSRKGIRVVESSKVASEAVVKEVGEKLVKAFKGYPVSFNEKLFLSYLPPFTIKVLSVVAKIPRGRVASYGGVARASSNPKALRGVGVALSLNPLPLIIPCHRVVRGNGSIGGYSYGVRVKEELLKREGVVVENGIIPKGFFVDAAFIG